MPSLARQVRKRTAGSVRRGPAPGAKSPPERNAKSDPIPSQREASAAPPDASALQKLARAISRHAPNDGVFPLRLAGTFALRRGKRSSGSVHSTMGPLLCIVAQGSKIMMLGKDVLEYDPSRMLILAVDLPIAGQVTRASLREPYLGFILQLDPERVAGLAARIYPNDIPKPVDPGAFYVGETTTGIVEAVARLLDLLSKPDKADLLGPLVVDEILIRLLQTPIGVRVAQIGKPTSGVHRVAQAVSWIRTHFAQSVTVAQIAASVRMSESLLYEQFKAVTSLSPLQYQKVLRLHEARRLMLFKGMNARDAGEQVGYLSPSQFSREYSRYFGLAPARDIAQLSSQGLDLRDTR
jgi:AraC-like DNA-binding protein